MTQDYDMKIHSNPDAQAWAKFFIQTKKEASWQIEDIDESLMLGWFANAMMAMHDHLKSQRTEQEPFAWAEFDGEGSYFLRLYENNETYAEDWNKRNPNHIGWVEPIYKYPPQRTWVGLTRDEQSFVYSNLHNATSREDSFWVDFANAIEAKLKEKNT